MSTLTEIDSSTVAEENAGQWATAVEIWGDKFSVPREEVGRIQQLIQGMYVLMGLDSSVAPFKALRAFGIPEDTCHYLIGKYCPTEVGADDEAASMNRRKKYAAFEEWAREHVGEQFSTQALADVSGFSYPTVLKFVKESPLFKRVKNGWWEPVVVETRH